MSFSFKNVQSLQFMMQTEKKIMSNSINKY